MMNATKYDRMFRKKSIGCVEVVITLQPEHTRNTHSHAQHTRAQHTHNTHTHTTHTHTCTYIKKVI